MFSSDKKKVYDVYLKNQTKIVTTTLTDLFSFLLVTTVYNQEHLKTLT